MPIKRFQPRIKKERFFVPIEKVSGGYKVHNVNGVHKTRAGALKQLRAVEISKKERGSNRGGRGKGK